MANPVQVEILKQGVDVWNAWRRVNAKEAIDLSDIDFQDAHLVVINLEGANLAGANFTRTNFAGGNLNGANLIGAELTGAIFNSTALRFADLTRSRLTDASLVGTDLTSANLTGARLTIAMFKQATLFRTDFSKAHALNTSFTSVDLSEAIGLGSIFHYGPSTIGIDTLYKSKGKIPEAFLRGCGVPDSFITQVKALIGAEEGIQFYSCFISYSSKDEEFARRLHGRLQQEHVRVWFAPEDIQGGKKLHEQIDEAIKVFDKLLIVLSPHSLTSEWVMTELRRARRAERREGKRKLFPIRMVDYPTLLDWECFDADGGQDLATEVRQYFIPDFTNWKNHDAFEENFARLLKDLRASEKV